jgi:xanthine dehydrogenase small subunit
MKNNQSSDGVLRFWKKGEIVEIKNVPPDRMLLDLLREDLRICDAKEGCASGDCGACTVVVADTTDGENLNFRAINSCIRPAHAVNGMALWSVADLANEGKLHPAQAAIVSQHGTQCGFCTPGVVMSLFSLYQRSCAKGKEVHKAEAMDALSGNLCRCTGYRSIVDAALSMNEFPMVIEDEKEIAAELRKIDSREDGFVRYEVPTELLGLLKLRAQFQDAQLIAGATDVGIWVKQGMRQYSQIIDLHRVRELRVIEETASHLCIGAAVPLQEAFDAIAKERPKVQEFARRFAGWPVRQSGTLGGNIANGSPIGDSMPLLLALDATVVMKAWRAQKVFSRELSLSEFYLGYKKNVMGSDEVLACIKIPHLQENEWLGLYKVSKRHEDDISAVCMAIRVVMHGRFMKAVRIGLGGVAAIPARAMRTESVLQDREDTNEIWAEAKATIIREFEPISDLRASDEYRKEVLGNLIKRAYLERTNQMAVRLEDLS